MEKGYVCDEFEERWTWGRNGERKKAGDASGQDWRESLKLKTKLKMNDAIHCQWHGCRASQGSVQGTGR